MERRNDGQVEFEDYHGKINRENFDICQYIPIGSENAIERGNLRFRIGLQDREMRKLIHFARRKIPILNMQDGKWYFIPDMNHQQDIKLLVRYVLQEESRLKCIAWSLKAARKTLKNCRIDYQDEKWVKMNAGKQHRKVV